MSGSSRINSYLSKKNGAKRAQTNIFRKAEVLNEKPGSKNPAGIAHENIAHSKTRRLLNTQALKIQAKLKVGHSNDTLEKEADSVADHVMSMPTPQKAGPVNTAGSVIQRQSKGVTGSLPVLNRDTESQISSQRGGGHGMPNSERSFFEPRFGRDFSGIRLHTNSHAAGISRNLNARAFTLGSDIFFGEGEYKPNSHSGRKLLAHELTHTVQQGGEKGVVRRFDTGPHKRATLKGLHGIFSAKDIGKISQHNWMRDISQAPPQIATIMIAWKNFKDDPQSPKARKAVEDMINGELLKIMNRLSKKMREELIGKMRTLLEPRMVTYVRETLKSGKEKYELVNSVGRAIYYNLIVGKPDPKAEKSSNAYGGSTEIDHMDQPMFGVVADADKRWYGGKKPGKGQLPGYILDSRSYIKENIADAVAATGSLGDLHGPLADLAWEGKKRPEGYGKIQHSYKDKSNAPSADAIGNLVEKEATKPGEGKSNFSGNQIIMDALGRATHALEDYFSHSNFVEVAKGKRLKGAPAGKIHSGAFDKIDFVYSTIQKIINLSEEITHASSIDSMREALPGVSEDTWGNFRTKTLIARGALIGVGGLFKKYRGELDELMGWQSHTVFSKDNPRDGHLHESASGYAAKADRYVFSAVKTALDQKDRIPAFNKSQMAFFRVNQVVNYPDRKLNPVFREWGKLK